MGEVLVRQQGREHRDARPGAHGQELATDEPLGVGRGLGVLEDGDEFGLDRLSQRGVADRLDGEVGDAIGVARVVAQPVGAEADERRPVQLRLAGQRKPGPKRQKRQEKAARSHGQASYRLRLRKEG